MIIQSDTLRGERGGDFPTPAPRTPGEAADVSSVLPGAANRSFAWKAEALDCRLLSALRALKDEIGRLAPPGLAGVVLGGGYGRGEGGVRVDPRTGREGFSNDLDLFAVTREGAGNGELAAIERALAPLGEKWSRELSVDVDFCVRTPWRLRHDEERLMVQELLRGHWNVWGLPGEELFRGVALREASALPWSEAARLLVNRGAGLLMAREAERGADFVARNLAKVLLGAGDARLIARRTYHWAAPNREAALADPLYSRALAWKFRPSDTPPCDWETARETWLAALEEVRAAQKPRRALRHALRWVWRRRTFGGWRTFGHDPLVRILAELEPAVRERRAFGGALERDWQVFN